MAVAKKRTIKSKVLPMMPSQLIDIAVRDMKAALKKGWVIDMSDWYNPKATVKCTVSEDTVIEEYTVCTACAAGAVMAISLANAKQQKQSLSPSNFSKNYKQLAAIDSLREGKLSNAADELGMLDIVNDADAYLKAKELNTFIPTFDMKKPEVFFKAMAAFSKKLKKANF